MSPITLSWTKSSILCEHNPFNPRVRFTEYAGRCSETLCYHKLHCVAHNNIPWSTLALLLVRASPLQDQNKNVCTMKRAWVDIVCYRQSRAVRCGIVQTWRPPPGGSVWSLSLGPHQWPAKLIGCMPRLGSAIKKRWFDHKVTAVCPEGDEWLCLTM